MEAAGTGSHELDGMGCPLYAADARLRARWAELRKAWAVAFPHVNVLGEVKKVHAWERSNPRRAKTDRARFLFNWLSRSGDRVRDDWQARERAWLQRSREELQRQKEAREAAERDEKRAEEPWNPAAEYFRARGKPQKAQELERHAKNA